MGAGEDSFGDLVRLLARPFVAVSTELEDLVRELVKSKASVHHAGAPESLTAVPTQEGRAAKT